MPGKLTERRARDFYGHRPDFQRIVARVGVYPPDSSFDIVDVMLVTSVWMNSPNGRASRKK